MTRTCFIGIMISILALSFATVSAEEISVSVYSERLERVRTALEMGDYAGAERQARELQDVEIRFGPERLQPDRSLFGPVARARDAASARPLIERLRSLAAALGQKEPPATPPGKAADAGLLERIKKEQQARDPRAGGEVAGLPDPSTSLPDWLLGKMLEYAKWAWNQFTAFFKWLWDLMFSRSAGEEHAWENAGPFTIMLLLLLLGIVALLVWDVIKKNRLRLETARPPAPATRAASADADPASRDSNEWEAYARQLVAQGSHREALRAWYHALLTMLFRAGQLHYRKGRTNWEYCSDLSPALDWRPLFMEATRGFENRWYGQTPTSPDDLQAYAEQVKRIRASLQAGP